MPSTTLPHPPRAAWNTSTPSKFSVEHLHPPSWAVWNFPSPLQAAWNTSKPFTGSMKHLHALHGQHETLPQPALSVWNTSTPSIISWECWTLPWQESWNSSTTFTGSVEPFHFLNRLCWTLFHVTFFRLHWWAEHCFFTTLKCRIYCFYVFQCHFGLFQFLNLIALINVLAIFRNLITFHHE